MENKENNIDEARVYELGYLLLPTITEEDVPVEYGNLKELIVSFGGTIISDDMPKRIPLAFTMSKVISNVRNKFNSAYFGWVKFHMEGDKLVELKKKLDLDPRLIRFLLIKTIKENTIAAKRFVSRPTYTKPAPKKDTDAPAAPINKEEIDKEIEAMVAA